MRVFVCSVCGYLFEEAKGDAKGGIAPGTKWEDVPESWVCPVCGAPKAVFEEKAPAEPAPEAAAAPAPAGRTFVCSVCGYVFEEANGDPKGNIAPGTNWEDVPESWVCPICGAPKAVFEEKAPAAEEKAPQPVMAAPKAGEPGALELAARCSNLARGMEKQYHPEEQALFMELADYYKAAAPKAEAPAAADLSAALKNDVESGFPAARAASEAAGDRGALRAITWGEKVTRMLQSLWTRYEKEGEAMLEGVDVSVCTVCGFIFVGNDLPEVCPVCKVPNWKFRKIEGRAF